MKPVCLRWGVGSMGRAGCVAFVAALVTMAATGATASSAPTPADNTGASAAAPGAIQFQARPTYHTVLPYTPDNANSQYNALHRPGYGGEFSGVPQLFLNTTRGGLNCSGALLASGLHVLTAAHCVTDEAGRKTLIDGFAAFPSDTTGKYTGTSTSLSFSQVTVHKGYNGDFLYVGNDIAVITLDSVAPKAIQRYDLYTGRDEVGKVGTKLGWGAVGTGDGNRPGDSDFLRGENRYDATASLVTQLDGSAPVDSVLHYDFDNGKPANDAFGLFFGVEDLGRGLKEVMTAPGDSGGPTFIDGLIAGITSYDLVLQFGDGSTSDITPGRLDSSFGEIGGDTRVSSHTQWIYAAMVPEPSQYAMLLAGLMAVGVMARRRGGRVD
jgi:secreted trypsin-like serine protease